MIADMARDNTNKKRVEITMALQVFVLLIPVFMLSAYAAQAHTIRPAVVTVTFSPDETFQIEINTNVEALLTKIGPQHADTDDSPSAELYNMLRAFSPDALSQQFVSFAPSYLDSLEVYFGDQRADLNYVRIDVPDVGDLNLARDSLIVFEGKIPSGAQEFGWRYPENYGSNVLRLRYASSEDMQAFFLLAGETAKPFELTETIVQRSRLKVAIDYVGIGFTHILPLGLDHILFVLGIFLLSLRLSPILWQVTAFTIAHTITLGLSIYGLISLPSSIVEPLIALSIVYVGVENILIGELRSWRVVIVFLFGLLHGLGFAGILIEIGLPRSEFLTALITFNVGVEFGQLAVISIALLAVGWFRHRPWYRSGIVVPASAMISIIGLYWTIERVL